MSFLAVSQELLAWVQRHIIFVQAREHGLRLRHEVSDQQAYEELAAILEPVRVELEHLHLATQENGFRSIFEALDDLWAQVRAEDMEFLGEDTKRIARANHHALHHTED